MKPINYNAPLWFINHDLVKLNINIIKKQIPLYRYHLVKQVTPIQKLNSDLLDKNYTFYIKRDDLTHEELHLQGNKLRKLEFLFADAVINYKAKHILTAGGLQSNHCRAVASLANKLGLKAHLFLRSHTNKPDELEINGNLLVNRLLDANIYLIEKRAQYIQDIEYKMDLLEDKIKLKYNEQCYKIPVGGSNTIGLFGYLECFNEMLNQNIDNFIDDIIITTGSGGTMSGLAIANYLTGSRFKIHAFCVCDNKSYFQSHLTKEFFHLFGQRVEADKLVNIIECSKGSGYGQSSREELEFIANFFQSTNILLDPVYTAKTVYTFLNLINGQKPTLAYDRDETALNLKKNLKGNRILFIHTGGQLGLFDNGKLDIILKNKMSNVFNSFNENIMNIDV